MNESSQDYLHVLIALKTDLSEKWSNPYILSDIKRSGGPAFLTNTRSWKEVYLL